MTTATKSKLTEIIAGLFILLFIYTAVSKLLNLKAFQHVLQNSPLTSGVAPLISVAVPAAEIIISVLLFVPGWRIKGLVAALLLVVGFTVYIGYMMLTTPHLPCSCGGVIRQLSWKQHLLFNSFFILLALAGILLDQLTNPVVSTQKFNSI